MPESATFSVFADQPREAGPLYCLPFEILTELPVSAVVLGIAQHAVDEFAVLAHIKPAHGATTKLEHFDLVQDAIRTARTWLDQATRALYGQANTAWEAAMAGRRLGPNDCTYASVRAVRLMVSARADLVPYAGMNAIHGDDEFAVAWRDLQAAAAHYSVSPINLLPSMG